MQGKIQVIGASSAPGVKLCFHVGCSAAAASLSSNSCPLVHSNAAVFFNINALIRNVFCMRLVHAYSVELFYHKVLFIFKNFHSP